MTTMARPVPRLLAAAIVLAATGALVAAGGLDPKAILKPLGDAWPTYSGDYSGRRYSTLSEITQSNVKRLSLAWASRLVAGPGPAVPVTPPPFGPKPSETIVGGVGDNDFVGATVVKGAVLAVDGVLYVTSPDNVWALDAQDGRELWHFYWRTRGGTHIGNRGAAMWGNYLFFVTPDDYLISLDARTGRERWHKEIAPFSQQYFLTSAPVVVDNHVIVGTGNDLDSPGYLQSFDPETGELQWKWYAVPMNPGDPGLETWKNLDAARNGGGHPWLPGLLRSRDPPLYLRHRQPDAGLHQQRARPGRQPLHLRRGRGARRYRQDGLVLPDLAARHARLGLGADADPGGRHHQRQAAQAGGDREPQRLLLHARSPDRRAAGHEQVLRSGELGRRAQRRRGSRAASRRRTTTSAGALVSSNNSGATNWPPQAFSPDTGLLYVPSAEAYAMYYLTETDPRGAMGLGGKDEVAVATMGSYIAAIDYKTGRTVWRHRFQTTNQVGPGTGPAGHRGQAPLRRRRVGQLLRDGSGQRRDAVARAHRHGVERAADLPGRRPAARAGGRRRHALRVRAVSIEAGKAGKAGTAGAAGRAGLQPRRGALMRYTRREF